MLHEEVKKYRELSGDTNPNTPISRIGGYLDGYEKALEQEPKTGHWIEKDGFDGDVYYDCSECGESWTTIEGTPWDNVWNYCPSCGARMVEPQESEG